jgi:hypothetical protein
LRVRNEIKLTQTLAQVVEHRRATLKQGAVANVRLDTLSAHQRWSAPIARFAKLNLSTIISRVNLSSAWPSIGSCKVIWW